MEFGIWQIIWIATGLATIVASVLAGRGKAWRYLGRASVGVLFLFGGALLHTINLIDGDTYSGFADTAHFAWVTDAWEAVVPANPVRWIGLLTVFEVAVGVLAIAGGRWTQISYVAVLAFYLALTLFGGMQLTWFAVMVVPMVLLLRAERRGETEPPAFSRPEKRVLTGVGS